jgi:hypothetical protein
MNTEADSRAEQKIGSLAGVLGRIGCFSIGTVYVLIGVWAMLALLRLASPAADEQRILQRMLAFPLGRVLIAAVAFGALAYVLWLVFEAVFDPFHLGGSWRGLAERAGIVLSALAYGAIILGAGKVLLGSGGHGEQEQQRLVATVLSWPTGQWLVGAAGVAVASAGLYQVKYVYAGEHKRRLTMDERGRVTQALIAVTAWAGHLARSAILSVLGWFLFQAAWSFDPGAVKDTDSAFDFLGLGGGKLGDAAFAAVALGTVSYGLFMYISGVLFNTGKSPSTRQGRGGDCKRRGSSALSRPAEGPATLPLNTPAP